MFKSNCKIHFIFFGCIRCSFISAAAAVSTVLLSERELQPQLEQPLEKIITENRLFLIYRNVNFGENNTL
jgi:hypothetical protein